LSAQSTRRGATRRRPGGAAARAAPGPCAAPPAAAPPLDRWASDAAALADFAAARVPLRARASDARSPKKPPARQPRLLHRLLSASTRSCRLCRPPSSRPGSWPLSPSESAELGWGGPHSLRWEGGSVLAASSPARCLVRLRPVSPPGLLLLVRVSHVARRAREGAVTAAPVRPPASVAVRTRARTTRGRHVVLSSWLQPRSRPRPWNSRCAAASCALCRASAPPSLLPLALRLSAQLRRRRG